MQLHPVPLVGSPGRHRLSWDNPAFTTMRLLTNDGLELPGKSDTNIPLSRLGPAHGREMFGGLPWTVLGNGQEMASSSSTRKSMSRCIAGIFPGRAVLA